MVATVRDLFTNLTIQNDASCGCTPGKSCASIAMNHKSVSAQCVMATGCQVHRMGSMCLGVSWVAYAVIAAWDEANISHPFRLRIVVAVGLCAGVSTANAPPIMCQFTGPLTISLLHANLLVCQIQLRGNKYLGLLVKMRPIKFHIARMICAA